MIRKHVVLSIFQRNFAGYFRSPTGYVFIGVFIMLSAAMAFWRESFFVNNLANLDTLNQFFPFLLLFFVPAVAMSTWSEERKQGTDELLMTLPARDAELVVGKYLAALGIYAVALLFALSHLVVLSLLGSPDLGVMLGTYLGYGLLGGSLLAVGMVASLLTSSMTVAFILGALFCAVVVFLGEAGSLVSGSLEAGLTSLGIGEPFRDLTRGVLSLQAVVYFAALAVVMLYLNLILLRRRRTGGAPGLHGAGRWASLLVIGISLGVLSSRSGCRGDLTAEGVNSLSGETRKVLAGLKQTVYVQAFVSPEVTSNYVETRETLLSLLREVEARGGERVKVRVVQTEPYSETAREAEEKFGIKAENVTAFEGGSRDAKDVFMGVAFTSGLEEVVIPFLHRGLSVEYELTRALGVVSGAARKKVGVAVTDAHLEGGFDFQRMGSRPEWSILRELKRQYDVETVSLDQEVTGKYDALLAVMPSSLTQPQMDHLSAAIQRGIPTLLFDDPLPMFNPGLAPDAPKEQPSANPFMPPRGTEPKGDFGRLLGEAGIAWDPDEIAWDAYNPHPAFHDMPREYVFIGAESGNPRSFNPDQSATSGLQEMVLVFTGALRPKAGSETEFVPLLSTTQRGGLLRKSQIFRRGMFGGMEFVPLRSYRSSGAEVALAARARGKGDPKTDVIVVADADAISEAFFDLRRQGPQGLDFDNVTFVLNCVDVLAGDEAYVSLRKRRPRHRTLEAVEQESKGHDDRMRDAALAAEEDAERELAAAQASLDGKVKDLRERKDIDEQQKAIQLEALEKIENQRLEAKRKQIEDRKGAAVARSRLEKTIAVREIREGIRIKAVALPPILPLLLGILVFLRRLSREGRTL